MKKHSRLNQLVLIIFGFLMLNSTMLLKAQATDSDYQELIRIDDPSYGFMGRALWQPNGNLLATSFYESTDIRIFDALSGDLVYTLQTPSRVAPALGVSALIWSSNGNLLASAFEDDAINIWDLSDETIPEPLVINHEGRAPFLAWSADSQLLASAWGSDDNREGLLWDAVEGELVGRFDGDTSQIMTLFWSPDANFIATLAVMGRIQIWDASTYQPMTEFEDTNNRMTPMGELVWSPDSQFLVGTRCNISVDGCSTWRWNISSGEISEPFDTTQAEAVGMADLAWSPDGRFLASTDSSRNGIVIRDVDTGSVFTIIEPLNNNPTSISWSPDSTMIAVATGIIQVWSIDLMEN
jgi:WD40 repeat protein